MGLKTLGDFPHQPLCQLHSASTLQNLYLKDTDAPKTQNSTNKEQCLYWPPHSHQQHSHEQNQQPHLTAMYLGNIEFHPPLLQNQAQISFRHPEQRGRSSFGFIVVAVDALLVLFFQDKYSIGDLLCSRVWVLQVTFEVKTSEVGVCSLPIWKPAARPIRLAAKKPTKVLLIISHGETYYGDLTAWVRNGSSTKHEAAHSLQGMCNKGVWVFRL